MPARIVAIKTVIAILADGNAAVTNMANARTAATTKRVGITASNKLGGNMKLVCRASNSKLGSVRKTNNI